MVFAMVCMRRVCVSLHPRIFLDFPAKNTSTSLNTSDDKTGIPLLLYFSCSEDLKFLFSLFPEFAGSFLTPTRGWVNIGLAQFAKRSAFPAWFIEIDNGAAPYQHIAMFLPATMQNISSPPTFIFCLSVSGHHSFQPVLFLRSQTLSDQMPSSSLKLRIPTPLILLYKCIASCAGGVAEKFIKDRLIAIAVHVTFFLILQKY